MYVHKHVITYIILNQLVYSQTRIMMIELDSCNSQV